MTRHRFTVVLAILAVGLGLSGCLSASAEAPIPLAQVDMARMYGGWYLLATVRNGFEKGMVEPYDVYTDAGHGQIKEDFYVRRGGFQAPKQHFVVHDWVRPGTHNAHWRVQILWPINLPFLVLYVDPQYRYVLFGEQNRKLGWIYSRTPVIPDADYAALLNRFQALGYDRTQFVKFVQTPDEIGQPGVWSDGIRR